MKACEKFLVDVQVQKRFILKFLFVFDMLVSNEVKVTIEPKQVEQVIA